MVVFLYNNLKICILIWYFYEHELYFLVTTENSLQSWTRYNQIQALYEAALGG